MDSQKFFQLFGEILASDTNRVTAATNLLRKDYYPLPESLSLLLQLLLSNQPSPMRQLAATQARSLVPKHWRLLAAGQKVQFRQQLLQGTLREEERIIRHSSARVITVIAKIDLDDEEWSDLFPALLRAANNSNPLSREVSTYLFYTTLEVLGQNLMDKFNDMLAIFSKTISDPDSVEVRINTMLALSRMAIVLDTENDEQSLRSIQDAIPQMVGVLKQAVDSGDMDRTTQCFEVFQTLLGCDSQIMNKHFRDLINFMINLAAQKSLDEDARTQAISFLMQCLRYRKLKVQGLKLGEQLTLKSLEIATELGNAAADDEDGTTPRSALGLLDLLASSLPPSQVVVPLLHALGPYVNSPDPDRRQGGIMALSMCVEGAPDFVATQLHEIFPLMLRLLEDPVLKVRRAALDAAMRLGEDLAEDWAKEHKKLVPALVNNLDLATRSSNGSLKGLDDETNMDIIRASCNAIDSLAEGLEAETLTPYLALLVPRLSSLFSHPHIRTKSSAISAMGAIASTAEENFLPYFEQTMTALQDYVRIKDSEDELDLRCTTCDAMGNMALAVGAKPFQRFVPPLMAATEEGLHLDHPKLKETSYLFWGAMAKVYGSEFKPFLEGVIKGLFDSLTAEESVTEIDLGRAASDLAGQEITIGGRKIKVAEPNEEESTFDEMDELSELDEDIDDEEDWDDVHAVTAIAQEKEIAIEVLGDIITHTSQDCLPYMEKTIEIILPLVEHSYEGARRAAIGTLFRVYAALWQLQAEDVRKWKPGLPVEDRLPSELKKLGEIIMTQTLAVWSDEEDRATVTDINRSIASTLKLCGPALISDPTTLKPVAENLLAVINKKHSCQQDFGDTEDMDNLEESSEYDWLIIDTALDAVIGLAACLGETFGQLWKLFEKPIMKLASGSEAFERSTSIGVIAECIRGMGSQATPFTTSLLKLLLHRLSDEDPETKSNAAFATGLLLENSTSDHEILKSYNTILAKLEPLLHTQEARAVDNAAGCVSRMIMKHQSHVPVAAVLPALVDLLPLKEDFEENEPVYKMIVQLYSTGEPTILSLTPHLLRVLDQVMAPPTDQLKDTTREQLTQLVSFVHGKQPALVRKYATLAAVVNS